MTLHTSYLQKLWSQKSHPQPSNPQMSCPQTSYPQESPPPEVTSAKFMTSTSITKTNSPMNSSNPRPNTRLSFQSSPKVNGPLPIISLHPDGIAKLLQHYPDPEFINTLTSIATYGARLGYEGSINIKIRRPNHASARLHPEVIDATIQSELDKGWIREIPSLPEFYYCSPIGLVPKKADGV